MKLATLKDGTRDGQLIVVSKDLHTAAIADAIAPTLQRVIEDWSFYAPQLQLLYEALNTGRARRAFGFDPKDCMAPLPRAFCMLDQRSAAMLEGAASASDESATLRRADRLSGAHDDVTVRGDSPALDFTAGFAAIVSDVPAEIAPGRAAGHVRLLMLHTTFQARNLSADQSADHACLARNEAAAQSGFSPVAVTLDELGDCWQAGRITRCIDVQVNGRKPAASQSDMTTDFGLAIARQTRLNGLGAGTVLLVAPSTLLAEQQGEPASGWLGFGDRVRLDMLDSAGESIFGVVEQTIAPDDTTADR